MATAALGALSLTVPTAVLPTPWFDREIAVTWWSYPVVAVVAILGGLVAATYVRPIETPAAGGRRAWVGGALTWFAVGCPVCNKLVLVALGYAGALTWFAPWQPVLAAVSILSLLWALRARLRGQRSCVVAASGQSTAAGPPPGVGGDGTAAVGFSRS
ncbi:hypothetical protein [Pseudonocardia sediminis]|uniref:hypothetical protein n=1 Tax=Pseudonocardia sediminis TaxID=1397368 RepID=UPI001A92DE9F|nr:hypothetical protein [Pseudonocardia sediminis]